MTATPALTLAAIAMCAVACNGAPGTAQQAGRDSVPHVVTAADTPTSAALAVTIDDLPWVGALRPGVAREDALRALRDTLAARHVPAMGFANCDRVDSGASLRMWLDAGLHLGNHTAVHRDLNDASLEQWLRDVRSCHELVDRLNGAADAWFRYPFLHQGPDAERQNAALAVLRELNSPIAHVTIDNSDWVLAVAYGAAVVAGDNDRAAAIGDAFVEHIIAATQHYQDVARNKVGRDVPHVLLLHANLLVADNIGRLLDRLQAEHGFRFVTVETAQRDPIYDRRDAYTGPDGLSWLYRMEPSTPELAAWDNAERDRLRAQWR